MVSGLRRFLVAFAMLRSLQRIRPLARHKRSSVFDPRHRPFMEQTSVGLAAQWSFDCRIGRTLVMMTDPGAAAGGGYLHMLPMYLPEGMTVTAMSAAMLPWGSPAYLGALGTTPEGDPVLAATLEWPVNWLRTTDPVPKFDREWLQLRRYNADQALAVGAHAFASILPGDDPPDAV